MRAVGHAVNVHEDIGYHRSPVPDCCRVGFSEEGFVHQWLEHFDQPTKDRVFKIADTEPWSRWLAAALAAEGAA